MKFSRENLQNYPALNLGLFIGLKILIIITMVIASLLLRKKNSYLKSRSINPYKLFIISKIGARNVWQQEVLDRA